MEVKKLRISFSFSYGNFEDKLVQTNFEKDIFRKEYLTYKRNSAVKTKLRMSLFVFNYRIVFLFLLLFYNSENMLRNCQEHLSPRKRRTSFSEILLKFLQCFSQFQWF